MSYHHSLSIGCMNLIFLEQRVYVLMDGAVCKHNYTTWPSIFSPRSPGMSGTLSGHSFYIQRFYSKSTKNSHHNGSFFSIKRRVHRISLPLHLINLDPKL